MSCLQGVSGFLQASQFFFYEVLSEKKWKSDIETVSLGHWQEKNQGLLPLLRKVKKENHTMNSLVVGNGAQWWLTCLAHSAPAAAAPSAGGSPRGLWSVPVHAGDVQTQRRKAIETQAWWGPAMSAFESPPDRQPSITFQLSSMTASPREKCQSNPRLDFFSTFKNWYKLN